MSSTEELNPPLRQQKRTFDTMEGNGSPPLTVEEERPESSQHEKSSIPRAESRIQKIPTKNPAKQYYSKQEMGGWWILNEKEAIKQMERERMMHMRNAESIRGELGGAMQNERVEETSSAKLEAAPPPPKKRKTTDYLSLIACLPTDRLWKCWENKHLLRSYANGLSFAQIASSREFSNGLVIRNEAECRAHFKVLHHSNHFKMQNRSGSA